MGRVTPVVVACAGASMMHMVHLLPGYQVCVHWLSPLELLSESDYMDMWCQMVHPMPTKREGK